MENNDNNNEDLKVMFENVCKATGAPPKQIFEDFKYFNKVVKLLLYTHGSVADRVRDKIFPNGRPSSEEFLITISKKLKPEDFDHIVREAKREVKMSHPVFGRLYKFIDWFKLKLKKES